MQASTLADVGSLARQHSERHGWLGSSESDTGRLAIDQQRGRTSGAKPPVETSGDEENCTHQNCADAADHYKGTATGETVQVRLMLVHDHQYPEDREADSFADQAHSSRDPL
jgi:hypothetical protein